MNGRQTTGATRPLKPSIKVIRHILLIASLGCFANWAAPASAQTNTDIRIIAITGNTVEYLQHGGTYWQPAGLNTHLHLFDRVRTGTNGRVVIQWSSQSVVQKPSLSELEIVPPEKNDDEPGLHLISGILSFFHRGPPDRVQGLTSGGRAGVKGTEFVMEVAEINGVEQTTLSVIDGQVTFSNAAITLNLTNDQQAVSEPGQPPHRTPGFIANNLLQWCFYYPGVLATNDLPLTPEEKNSLGKSLGAYDAGDLLAALTEYPASRTPVSDAERLYHAALLLSAGQVGLAETNLSMLTATDISGKSQRLAAALRTLIAAVKREPNPSIFKPELATELLAASYYAQSQAGPNALENALALARRAVTNAPDFGFGWERVAELEFSFGRTDRALTALNKALIFSPRNAQALALQGFLLAAENKTREAIESFNRALAVDSALGNAWLGRGLCEIRLGDAKAGREDLLIAAAMEPRRAALRSYLGKAFGDAGDTPHATHELYLAKQLDTNDPTAWLYSALLNEQNNRINEAIHDLEKSQELNDNRSVYRSGLLLDQDRAVRSANLARIYAEAGLDDIALHVAGESVAENYGSFGSHLFLANAYQQNEPAGPFGRRYETPAFSEHLITALLGPVDSRIISPSVSQQDYTRLFERDGAHISSDTEYFSRGAWTQSGVQYGTFGPTSYAVEADYLSDPGQADNAQLEFHSFSATVKQMLTPKDSVFFQVYESSWEGGDTAQHYDPAIASLTYQFKEEQSPNVLLGYHHEWSAESHTLFLASRFNDEANFVDPGGAALFLLADPNSPPAQAGVSTLNRMFNRNYTANTVELQQVQKIAAHTFVAGARLQLNDERVTDVDSAQYSFVNLNFIPNLPYTFPAQTVDVENDRASFYLSDFWQVNNQWLLFGGVEADYLRLARNTIAPPLSTADDVSHPISPRAGLLWKPTKDFSLSLVYAQSVTGQDLDQSIRLEPTDFAGLPLTFRTAFPDSLVGGLSGEHIEVWQGSGRFKLNQNTYGVLSLQHLESKVDEEVGSYTRPVISSDQPTPSTSRQNLNFQEDSLQFSLRHLFSNQFSAGVRYEVSHAQLKQAYAIPPAIFLAGPSSSFYEGVLHTLAVDALANLPNGIFAGATATWRMQTDLTDTMLGGDLAGDNFWQVDVFTGYRSPRRHFEIRIGLLNLTGTDYRLDPVNAYPDLARKPTLAVSMRLNF